MVVSIESQKVKLKKTSYLSRGYTRTNFDFNIVNLIKNNYKRAIYALVLFVSFLFITVFIKNIIISNRDFSLDVHSISLPYHQADLSISKDIKSYKASLRYDLYRDYIYNSRETLSSISFKYGVSINTILHVNGIRDIRDLKDGDKILIPQSDGYIHRVSKGDSLSSLSEKYSVPIKDIFRVNSLTSESLIDGSEVFIPGVDVLKEGFQSNINKYFIYPAKGHITKRYGEYTNSVTGLKEVYEGLDFTPMDNFNVYASKGGQVSRVGYNANYGNYIFIDHSGGFRTLYAHLESIDVSRGDKVEQYSFLGRIGNSGYVRKEKLFFCMMLGDQTINPEDYLK